MDTRAMTKEIEYGSVDLPEITKNFPNLKTGSGLYTIYEAYQEAQYPSDKWYPYLDFYHEYLSKYLLRSDPLTLIEVGVQEGGSLDMWAKYLPHTRIIGIDIDPVCVRPYDSRRIEVVIGDQGKEEFWNGFLPQFVPIEGHPRGIDIFIDDGGHFCDDQILTLHKVWPFICDGGTYIVEDTHTSYMPYNGGGLGRKGSFVEFAKKLIDVLHYNWSVSKTTELIADSKRFKDLTGIHFHDSFVVMEKSQRYHNMTRISNRDEKGNPCLREVPTSKS
jgi:hypothetical protein